MHQPCVLVVPCLVLFSNLCITNACISYTLYCVLKCVLLIPWISRYQQCNGFNACINSIKDPIVPQYLFYIFSIIIVKGIFVNNFFNASNQTMHKNNLCIINASITNTLYLALFLYTLPNGPLKFKLLKVVESTLEVMRCLYDGQV